MPKKFIDRTPAEQIAAIRKRLGHQHTGWSPVHYLDTGIEDLNSVFGHPTRGIPYGKMLELSGPESNGKSAVALDLIARAQRDGATCFWLDAENSLDADWMSKRKVDVEQLYTICPYVGTFGKEKEQRLSTAEELCAELEAAIMAVHAAQPESKCFAVVDSVTALLTEDESGGGITDQNMRTKLALASFLNRLLRRWVGTCQSTNTTMLFINQLRINPTQMFGNPEYSPGGKALKFYCHGRVKLRRASKGGKLMKAGEQVGIQGVLTSLKSKMGAIEGSTCGYKIYWSGKSLYLPASQVKA